MPATFYIQSIERVLKAHSFLKEMIHCDYIGMARIMELIIHGNEVLSVNCDLEWFESYGKREEVDKV